MSTRFLRRFPLLLFLVSATAVSLFHIGTRITQMPNDVQAQALAPHSLVEPVAYLPLVTIPEAPCVYVETNDAVVIEIESVPAVDDWQHETSFPGYTGSGYYVWRGQNYNANPGQAILTYPISVTKASDYQLNIRNSHGTNPSLYNDVWARLDSGPWIKSFSNVLNMWTYDFNFDQNGNLGAAVFKDVTPGIHTLELSARSTGFRLDRLVFSANGMGQLDSWPQSPCVVP